MQNLYKVKALTPYKHIFILNPQNQYANDVTGFAKSKTIYEVFSKQKSAKINSLNAKVEPYRNPYVDIACIFKKKLLEMEEVKLT